MQLTVFGAGGQTGQWIVRYALEAGHLVRAFVRSIDGIEQFGEPNLEVITGDALDPARVADSLVSADAVLSVLGVADYLNPGTFLEDAMDVITAQMAIHDVSRIVALAGGGILDTDDGNLRVDMPGFPTEFLPMTEAHRGTWDALERSSADWTLPCAPAFSPGPRGTRPVLAAANVEPAGTGPGLTAGDIASWMLTQVQSAEFARTRVGIGLAAPTR